MYKGIGIEFCWVPSHCGLYWNEIDKLAKQGAMKNMSEISNNLLLSSHEINSLLKKTIYIYKQIEKSKSVIPSCSRHLARVIYIYCIYVQVTFKFMEH